MKRRARPRGHSGSTSTSRSTQSGSIKLEEETSFTNQDLVILTESKLARVLNVLSEARDKWFDIGIQLGIPTLTLKDIEKKCSTSSDTLRDMLIFCCSQRRIRIKDLVQALSSRAVDLQVCAKDLETLLEELSVNEDQPRSPHLADSCDSGDKQGQHPIVRRLTRGEAKGAKCSHHFEVIVVGDSNVGKSFMLSKYGFKTENDAIRSTVTPEPLGYRVFKYRDKHVRLQVWDMPGSCSCFEVVNKSILESADGAILLFDVTNKQSLINLVSDERNSRQIQKSWMKELRFKAKGDKCPVMILVGNKIDSTGRKVTNSDVEQLLESQDVDLPYFEISAKENVGIEDIFTSFVVLLMRKAAKDKRYGRVKEEDSSNSNHHSHEDTVSSEPTCRHNMAAITYPPDTATRRQPVSHPTKSDSKSTSQSQKCNGCICC